MTLSSGGLLCLTLACLKAHPQEIGVALQAVDLTLKRCLISLCLDHLPE